MKRKIDTLFTGLCSTIFAGNSIHVNASKIEIDNFGIPGASEPRSDFERHMLRGYGRKTTSKNKNTETNHLVVENIAIADQKIERNVQSAQIGPIDTQELRNSVTLDGVLSHLNAFQSIANANGGNRASGYSGYTASRDYVVQTMLQAGYNVTLQELPIDRWQLNGPPIFSKVSPKPREEFNYVTKEASSGFTVAFFSGSNSLKGVKLQGINLTIPSGELPNDSTSGCYEDDFSEFEKGNVALIQRGGCSQYEKIINAITAGARAVVLFNEGQSDQTGTIVIDLGKAVENGADVPVLFTSYEIGEQLAKESLSHDVRVDIFVNCSIIQTTTDNVIAEIDAGSKESVVVITAHLDSVKGGPGINDNGSGSSVILETAIQLAALGIQPKNKLKFVWFAAEENGLDGSYFFMEDYISRKADGISETFVANLNFDMVASPNAARVISYDEKLPTGSRALAKLFEDFYDSKELPWEYETADSFLGVTDYDPFYEQDIPGGSIFSGIDTNKSAAQALMYGGNASEPFDKCYHKECDDIYNLNLEYLSQNAQAIAHAVMTTAMVDLNEFLDDNTGFNRTLMGTRLYRKVHRF